MSQPVVSAGRTPEGVEASVSKLLPLMDYSVESSSQLEGGFIFLALKPEPLGGVRTLVYVSSGKSISQNRVKRVLASAVDLKASKVVMISESGFSASASSLASTHGVDVLDGDGLESLLLKYGVHKPPGGKIFEYAFDLGVTLPEARKYFEGRRGRRLLGWGVDEKVVEVEGRYAPVGSFLVRRREEVKTGLFQTPKTASKSNVFYVNLNTSELYYWRSGLGRSCSVGSSDVLKRVVTLPVNSLRMFSGILKDGETSIKELNQRYELFYEERMGEFRVLLEEGLLAPTPDGEGVMPNLTLPAFESPNYDLKRFASVVKSVSSTFQVDEIKYSPRDVVRLLEMFYAGGGEVGEVVYMPYYTCVYADDRRMSRSEILLAPKCAPNPI